LTGADDVGTATALDTVGAFTAFPAFTDDVDGVVAAAPLDEVVAETSLEAVPARASVDGVVATESVHMVVARARVDGVSVIGAGDRVAVGCALNADIRLMPK
jgi:hypothetical protein